MIKKLQISNFKCFQQKESFDLSQVNLLYGMNGRGKSSFIQVLLLLSQTFKHKIVPEKLIINGTFVKLGEFLDIVNSKSSRRDFAFTIEDEKNVFDMQFAVDSSSRQLASLQNLKINGIDKFSTLSTRDTNSPAPQKSYKTLVALSEISIFQFLRETRYISASRMGPKNYVEIDTMLPNDEVGIKGEHVINVLLAQGENFQKQVCRDLSYILSGASLEVKENFDRIELYLNSIDNGDTYSPINVGFGYSYLLSIITSVLLAKDNSLLIIENPEAHLHPGAQSRLMRFLVNYSKEHNIQLIIETHSDHIVNGLRISMKESKLLPKDAEIIFFSHNQMCSTPEITQIKCDDKGELSIYPDDFMDEWTNQLLQLV